MASDRANVPSDTVDQAEFVQNCEKCSTVMTLLGVLPALSIRAAIRVFRCYACDHVVAERI